MSAVIAVMFLSSDICVIAPLSQLPSLLFYLLSFSLPWLSTFITLTISDPLFLPVPSLPKNRPHMPSYLLQVFMGTSPCCLNICPLLFLILCLLSPSFILNHKKNQFIVSWFDISLFCHLCQKFLSSLILACLLTRFHLVSDQMGKEKLTSVTVFQSVNILSLIILVALILTWFIVPWILPADSNTYA